MTQPRPPFRRWTTRSVAVVFSSLVVVIALDYSGIRWVGSADQVDLSSGRLRDNWQILGLEFSLNERDSFVSSNLQGARAQEHPNWVPTNIKGGLFLQSMGHSGWASDWVRGQDIGSWMESMSSEVRKECARRFLESLQADEGYPNSDFRVLLEERLIVNIGGNFDVEDLPQPGEKVHRQPDETGG